MRYIPILFVAALLAGCGVESLGTAATAGALKQQEIEQGEQTRDRARQRIDAATEQMRQRQERTAERIDGY